MKKFILSTFLIVLISENVLADWSTHRYFQCAVTKRYTARAKLKQPGQTFYSQTYDSGCTYAETTISSFAVTQNPSNNCAYAWVKCDKNGSSGTGWAQCGWSYGDDLDYQIPLFSFLPMYSSKGNRFEDESNFTKAELKDEGISFDQNTNCISLKNLSGMLQVSSSDRTNSFSTFQIEIYQFEKIEGNITPGKILWKAKASIINGVLYLEGNFSKQEFKSKSKEGNFIYEISDITKSISIDPEIKIENVCVKVSGDGGNLGIGISPEYVPDISIIQKEWDKKNNGKTTSFFDFYVQTSNTMVNAVITKKCDNRHILEAAIVTLSGEVKKVSNSISAELSFQIEDLPAGAYLLRLKTEDGYFSKKFIR